MSGYIIGIDPGIDGAIALICGDQLVSVHDMPVLEIKRGKGTKKWINAPLLADILLGLPACPIVIEGVTASPQMGATSAFSFGRALGLLEGAAAMRGVRVHLPAPATWKRDMGLTKAKDASRAMAVSLWPDRSDLFARVKDDGRAEAALLAEWGRRGTW